ncbi:protein FAR1-RELATED SEQUENCE 5-like [Olea europaea var. sylvestris]|uniref:protein FAR1-RELATED SEQUENCE 5-like n=1 Tax=Olea europaea var. sylvestris TaxID=158386 RepID=UPI000C1D0869|nr:protein FAR1-RELATED SEQUENCE 5-like [Olea europaea var. sylvestris]
MILCGAGIPSYVVFYSMEDLSCREKICEELNVGMERDEELFEVKRYNRLETRTGCKFMVLFIVDCGIWKISHINTHHNHELARREERQFLKSGRRVSNDQANDINSMVNVGIRPKKSYFYLAIEVGGAENIGFTIKDMRNYLQRIKGEMIEAGDGQTLLNHFKLKQSENPNFFYSMQYNLTCAPFIGVNHPRKNVLLGCAFLLDETTESFIWLFESFKESMGNGQLKTIFIDEDKAMANAIEVVFPHMQHRLCTWHIAKNATHHSSSYYANPEFKSQFNKCFHLCYSKEEFQVSWDDMIKQFDLGSHSWLKKLYSL